MKTRSSTTAEIARDGSHYAVHGHLRSLILIRIASYLGGPLFPDTVYRTTF